MLEFNQHQKSDNVPFIIYADLECLMEKIDGCKNKFHQMSTTLFKSMENRYVVPRGKDCMKTFCESLGEHTIMKIILKRKK